MTGFLSEGAAPEHQMRWDSQTENFIDMLDCAEVVLRPPKDSGESTSPFTADAGVIPMLLLVIHRCRDPFVRRRGLALLRSSERQEGLWDGIAVAETAEKLVELEENGSPCAVVCCSSDIPLEARISATDVVLDAGDRRATIKYYKAGPNGDPLERLVFEKQLSW